MIISFLLFERNTYSKGLKYRLKDEDYLMSSEDVLRSITKEMPDELMEFIFNWDKIKKSPYSQSWYDDKKTWDTFEGKYRVSDHWNFFTWGNLHCKTIQNDIINNEFWYVGIYDKETDKYDIVKRYPILNNKRHSDFKEREFRKINNNYEAFKNI